MAKQNKINPDRRTLRGNQAHSGALFESGAPTGTLGEMHDGIKSGLRDFLDGLDEALLVFDRERRCRYLNKTAERMLDGLDLDLLGTDIWDMYAGKRDTHVHEALERALQESVLVDLDGVLPPENRWYNIRAFPSVDGLWVRLRDVTEERKNEVELRSLSRVFSDAADSILILDLGGQVLAMNDEAERTFRCKREAVVGRSATALIPPDRHHEMEGLLARCRDGEQVRNIETLRRRSDGEVFPVLTSLSLVTDETGTATAITAISKDITELKRKEHSLRASRTQLAEEARLTAVSELAAGLAHELNQPLTAIAQYCDAALSIAQLGPPVDSELVDAIREAYEQTQRAGDIIRTLRNLIGRKEPVRSAEDLHAVIRDTTRFLMAEIRSKSTRVELTLADGLPPVSMDRVEIQQVLMNLVLNSLEAMEGAASPNRRLTISTAVLNQEACVTVQDTGPGVDPVIESRLYDPFQTSKPEGLGLGLWICRSILEAHHGRIWVESRADAGATFHFTLPFALE